MILDKIWDIIKVYIDGSFESDIRYFSYQYLPEKMFNNKFIKHFGEPRTPQNNSQILSDYADIAASIQKGTGRGIIENGFLSISSISRDRIKETLSGGGSNP